MLTRTAPCLVALGLLVSLPAAARQQGFQDPLLDRLVGTWVMRGTIAGARVTHDVVAEWVLGHHYLRLREVARERTEDGEPAYEAIVLIGWDAASGQYVCLWLDSTGGEGLSNGILGRAERSGDELPFRFADPSDGSVFHNTFAYDRADDTWRWRLDSEGADGQLSPFARVTLTRR